MKNYVKTGIILLLLLAALVTSAHAQFLGGFFSQGATQNQYLEQQIAALQVYDGYLQKGYSIAKEGTGAISTIKNGDLNLHTGHIDSLKIVSSSVRNYSRVKGITTLQQQIITAHNNVYPQLTKSKQFTPAELTNFNTIYQSVLQQSQTDLEELQLVITNGKLSLTDNERISRIDKLYKEMQNLYGKEQRLNNQALALAAQRSRKSKDNKTLKSLYGQ
ncbi:hypothetical protein [Mucilaginibacter sp. dw_454]|uniref:hypothetical protein n=1 Tax=Mucilaginibacter sp. dw_454 TaxID=2720079 RepID=UPI001BD323BF|nr:hypothetical protein [Mucilaginibacter sp. dw_454]